jgi:hypothetical protein
MLLRQRVLMRLSRTMQMGDGVTLNLMHTLAGMDAVLLTPCHMTQHTFPAFRRRAL